MNEVLNTIAKRYSCRAFDGRLPDREQLEAIALAAVQSPSAINRQLWRIQVITDVDLIREMDEAGMSMLAAAEDKSTYQRFMDRGGTLFYNTPCMFLVLQQAGTEMDSGIVSENITLAATSLGLGSVICGMAAIPFDSEKGQYFRERVGIGNEWEFGISVLVGYAVGSGAPHEPDLSKIQFIE